MPVKPALTDASASFDEALPAGKSEVEPTDNSSIQNAATPPESNTEEEPKE